MKLHRIKTVANFHLRVNLHEYSAEVELKNVIETSLLRHFFFVIAHRDEAFDSAAGINFVNGLL